MCIFKFFLRIVYVICSFLSEVVNTDRQTDRQTDKHLVKPNLLDGQVTIINYIVTYLVGTNVRQSIDAVDEDDEIAVCGK